MAPLRHLVVLTCRIRKPAVVECYGVDQADELEHQAEAGVPVLKTTGNCMIRMFVSES